MFEFKVIFTDGESKGYDVIISAYDVTNKFLSHDSIYFVNVVV